MARRAPSPARPSIFRGLASTLVANPTSTAGGLVMTAMAVAIMTNALALQSGRHPHPLFLGTRPDADAAAPATPAPRETLNLRDRAMVAEIQLALKTQGYYTGDVDGLPGPMTTGAITAFQKAAGLKATGAPSEALLERLKDGPGPRSALEEPAPEPRPVRDLTDLIDTVSAPLPTPSPRRSQSTAAADPVDAPAPSASPDTEPEITAALPEATPIPADAVPVPVEPVRASGEEVTTPTPAVVREAAPVAPPPAPPPVAAREPAPPPVAAREPVPVAVPVADADPRIAKIQGALDQLGFGPLKADGVMTSRTREAIRHFQESRGLPPTGAINERFLKELIRIGGLAKN